MTAAGSLELIAIEISKLFEPLARELAPDSAKGFFHQIGVTLSDAQVAAAAGPLNTASGQVTALLSSIAKLIPAVAASDYAAMAARVAEALSSISQIVQSLSAVGTALAGAAGMGADRLAKRIFDYAAFRYLENSRINDFLELGGLLEREDHGDDPVPFTIATYHFDRIGSLFSNPFDQLRTEYGWGDGFDGKALFSRIEGIVARANFPVIYDDTGPVPKLDLVLLEAVPKTDVTPHGLLITLRAKIPAGDQKIDFGANASLHLKADFQPPFNTAAAILPNGSVTLTPPAPGPPFSGTLQAQFIAQKTTPPEPFLLFGAANGSRIQFGKFQLTTGINTSWSGSVADGSFFLAAEADDLKIVIDTSSGDGFLAKILPSTRIEANLSVQMGISTARGFYFNGSSALQLRIPAHIDLGPIGIEGVIIEAGLAGGDVPISIGADIRAELGPLVIVVQNMGFRTTFSFRADNRGNLGPLHLNFAFKPPKGLGLSVDAGVVIGGGYLYFDFEKEEYAGALELSVMSIVTVKAIGLVTTRMPDGSKGFSLLIIISAEFTGIQLGFGFTLTGLGGLLGLNRTMQLTEIATGVRTGGINSVMFPHDVVANAPRIISDLRVYFPPQEGRFLIGLMARIGWGTPTLASLSLGIIVEIPPGKVAILGILKVALPSEDAPLIIIQVNFIGAIEPDKERLWFFAELFESRVLFISIEGGMGLLVAWGDNANFVLSVGGFHPRFNPPPLPFPVPKRIALDIINTPVYRIRVEGYFAVTSNTVQFGARAELRLGLDEIGIFGHIAFDALFQFSPFYFIIEISGSVELKVFGLGLFSIRLEFSLEGTTPWRAKGKGTLSLLFFDVSADFDITWGDKQDTTLPPIPVLPLLVAEFSKTENWRAELPRGNKLLVSLRSIEETAGLVLHPVGALIVSQRGVPLDLDVAKVGSQKVADAKRFSVRTTTTGLGKRGDRKEQFAMGQFLDLSNDEKLSRKGYELQNGGVELSTVGRQAVSSRAVKRIVRHEMIVIDSKYKSKLIKFFMFSGTLFAHFLRGNAAAKSPLSQATRKLFVPFEDKVKVQQEGYVVATNFDNKPFNPSKVFFDSEATAFDFMHAQTAANPDLGGVLHVIPAHEAVTH